MTLRASVFGVTETIRAMGRKKKDTTRTIVSVLHQTGEMILKASQKYVPVETGALKASGMVTTTGSGLGASVEVSYGKSVTGTPIHYAVYVHEDPEAFHAPPTCYKFLSRAVRETAGARAALVKKQLGMTLGGK